MPVKTEPSSLEERTQTAIDQGIYSPDLRNKFEKEIKNGNIPSSMSYSEWLERLRTKLNAGGKVSKAKIKEPAGTKQIDLMPDFHKLMGMLAKMSPQERRSIQWLLDRGLGKKK